MALRRPEVQPLLEKDCAFLVAHTVVWLLGSMGCKSAVSQPHHFHRYCEASQHAIASFRALCLRCSQKNLARRHCHHGESGFGNCHDSQSEETLSFIKNHGSTGLIFGELVGQPICSLSRAPIGPECPFYVVIGQRAISCAERYHWSAGPRVWYKTPASTGLRLFPSAASNAQQLVLKTRQDDGLPPFTPPRHPRGGGGGTPMRCS